MSVYVVRVAYSPPTPRSAFAPTVTTVIAGAAESPEALAAEWAEDVALPDWTPEWSLLAVNEVPTTGGAVTVTL
jgi:hypothetical protein